MRLSGTQDNDMLDGPPTRFRKRDSFRLITVSGQQRSAVLRRATEGRTGKAARPGGPALKIRGPRRTSLIKARVGRPPLFVPGVLMINGASAAVELAVS